MDTVNQAGLFVVQTFGLLALMIVVLRLLLQFARADYYNPISQFIVKVTQPAVGPLRRMIPAIGRLDTATLVLALFVQWIAIQVSLTMFGNGLVNPLPLLGWGAIGIASLILKIYLYGLLAVIILSWVAPQSQHPAITLVRQMLEPIAAPFRRIIPPMGGLDLSPIFIFLVLNVLQIFLHGIARSMMAASPLLNASQIVPGL